MLFNFDPYKLAVQLCPPILRSGILVAILKALSIPFRYIIDRLKVYRQDIKDAVLTTSNVVVLEGALNYAFHLTGNQIYITTMTDLGEVYFFQSDEKKVTYVHTREEQRPLLMLLKDGAHPGPSFTVHVPNFLATSMNYDEDEFYGKNLAVIVDIIHRHKPVGKSFSINIYNYE